MENDNRRFLLGVLRDGDNEFHHTGPARFTDMAECIGTECRPYTYSELLKLPLSKTNLKKLKTLKKGKWLKIRYSSRGSNFGIWCLPESLLEIYKVVDETKENLRYVRERIRETVPDSLLNKEKEYNKKLRKVIKEMEKEQKNALKDL